MNLAQVARLLSLFTLFFALIQAIPLVWSLVEEPPVPTDGSTPIDAAAGFGVSIALGLVVAAILYFAGRDSEEGFFRKEGLGVVGFSWLIAGALAAIPYQWSGALPNGTDALFESISGLTTTGASVLGSRDNHTIEDLPDSLLFWRSLTQWLGGLGIVLVFVVLLPAMGVTGKNLLDSEQVGVSKDTLRPRMREQARGLFRIYLALTGSQILLLWGLSPMGFFDAMNHAFTTMATGGFSTRNTSIAAYDSLSVEIIVTLFMFLAGCNFTLLSIAALKGYSSVKHLWTSTEFRVYTFITLGLILGFAIWLRIAGGEIPHGDGSRSYDDLGRCLRDSSFNVVSVLTSTGYGTANFQFWPGPLLLGLTLCMLCGGCAGSTAGGLKVVRVMVATKLVSYTLRHFIRPKSVERIRYDGEPLAATVISGIVALILLWFGVVLAGALVLSLDHRLDMFTSLTASASMSGCTGPALTSVMNGEVANAGGLDLGPFGGFGDLHGGTKIFLAFQMVLGRLEVLAPMVLLAPSVWRR